MGLKVIPTNILKFAVDVNLDNFEQYAITIEDLLAREQSQFESHVEEEKSKWPGQDIDEFFGMYENDYRRLSEVFPDLLRKSFFVACYSFLEHTLLDLCRYLQKKHKYTVELSDLAEKGVFKARTYLKKVVGVDFPDRSALWTDITNFSHIRNFIVHNNGQLNKTKDADTVRLLVKQKKWISIDAYECLQLTGDFYKEIIGGLRNFFEELLVALSKIQIPE